MDKATVSICKYVLGRQSVVPHVRGKVHRMEVYLPSHSSNSEG